MYKFTYLDAEFTNVAERDLRLVCLTLIDDELGVKDYWLDDGEDTEECRIDIVSLMEKKRVFCSFSVESEARVMLSLRLEPLNVQWVDLYIEFKMLQNHNEKYMYGFQLNSEGKKIRTFVGDKRAKSDLATALFKMLDLRIDTAHKKEMRELIISSPESFNPKEKKDIMDYCRSDTQFLPKLREKLFEEVRRQVDVSSETLQVHQFSRGKYAVLTAHMVTEGYPISIPWAKNLTNNVPILYDECIREINELFPDIKPFRFNKSTSKWVMNQTRIKGWIEQQGFKDWLRTDKKALSLSMEAWTEHFNFSHSYPKDNFGAQMVRYLKLRQSLNGMSEASGESKKKFWDYVGSDGRVRPYFGIYVAQSSRSQPASTGYVFLKPAWQRSLVQPNTGRAICGIDYSSEEFLLGALLSMDKVMYEAYKSGDVYLSFGKSITLIPKDGTKAQYKKERDLCKGTVLGLSYMMTKKGLSRKLSVETGEVVTEDDAQDLVQAFYDTYMSYSDWRNDVIKEYKKTKKITLPCGWTMFGDNRNERSVGNVSTQGLGACIMRKAVEFCHERGLKVIMTLHDALYIEYDSFDFDAIKIFKQCMYDAFLFYFKGRARKWASCIRMDAETWSPDYTKGEMVVDGMEVAVENIHIDERAIEEYQMFNKHFLNNPRFDLLGLAH